MSLKILYIHRAKLGAFGEAAINYFPAKVAVEGHKVSFVALAGGNAGFLESHHVDVVEIAKPANWYPETYRLIRKIQPDIVHVFLHTGCGIFPSILRMQNNRPKCILDIRSPLLRGGFPRLLHRAKNLIEPFFFDAIMTHSIESAWTQLGKRSGLHFLPPGVDFGLVDDTKKLCPCVEEPVQGRKKLVYTGSLDKLRNPDRLVKAAMLASDQLDLQLDIYGDGSERAHLEVYVASMGKSSVIRFMGLVDRTVLFKKLPSYDLGLAYIPSGMYETAPALKTLEFLACGLPVLATNTYGNRMFVESGVNGYLADPDIDTFSEAIIKACSTSSLHPLKKNARASVEQYDWSTITRNVLIPVYQKLLSQNGSTG